MPLWANFIGPDNQAQSDTIAADTTTNIYLDTTRHPGDPKKATFYGTPGQSEISTLVGAVPCRGLFSQEGRVFGVVSDRFFEYLPVSNTYVNIHPVATDGLLVTFASNGLGGNQLAICSAGTLYILDLVTSVFTAVALPGSFVPVMVGYMDGYFLLNEKATPKMWFSHLFDGLTWSATDLFTRSSTSDHITGFCVNNRRIWVLGSKSTEIFQDSGDPTTPFVPYPGTVINEGTLAYASITSCADTVLWAGTTNEFGNAQLFAAASLQPQQISTPAISVHIAQSQVKGEAEALVYTQNGHNFVCWTWPSIETTFCYDLTEQAWHRRGKVFPSILTPTGFQINRWQARGCCAYLPPSGAAPQVLVGQWDSSSLCVLDLTVNTDVDPGYVPGGRRPIVRARSAPYLSAENQWIFLQQLELGIGALPGGLPAGQLVLRLSANNAQSWQPPIEAAATLALEGNAVVQWFQLGRYRSDRLLILIYQTVDAPCVWGPGLWMRLTPGTGQL